MSAAKAVHHLLSASAGLTAVVAAARIAAGVLPQNTALPAIAVTEVSRVRRDPVAAPSRHLYTSRVQVTIFAAKYPSQKQIEALVLAALPRSRGTVDGVSVEAILFDSQGPDFATEWAACMTSLDFLVTYTGT